MIPEESGDHSREATECGCPWDGKNCPHCGQPITFERKLLNRHMPRCHEKNA